MRHRGGTILTPALVPVLSTLFAAGTCVGAVADMTALIVACLAGQLVLVLIVVAFWASANLSIKNDYADNEVTTRGTYNTPVDYLDRHVEWGERFAGHGTETGWALQSNKTVSAGSGFIYRFWANTVAAANVTGWTNGVVNYVNASENITVDAAGNVTFGVSFAAITSSVVPTGAIPIASCTLDSSGSITGDISHSRKTYAYNYQWTVLTLNITQSSVAASSTVTATIPLGDTLYGGYTVDLTSEAGFTAKTLDYRTTQFKIEITNTTGYIGDYTVVATVRGLAGV